MRLRGFGADETHILPSAGAAQFQRARHLQYPFAGQYPARPNTFEEKAAPMRHATDKVTIGGDWKALRSATAGFRGPILRCGISRFEGRR